MKTNIRIANKSDARFVHDVYGYYVKNTNVTFSTVNPTVEDYEVKIKKTLAAYPFFILEVDGNACGFAYAGQIRPHEAYQWTAEATIYLTPETPKRKGLGKLLYQTLLDALREMGIQTVFGVITATNEPSIQMHVNMGFAEVGRFQRMGNKHGEWLDVVWMQKSLAVLKDDPNPPISFSRLHAK